MTKAVTSSMMERVFVSLFTSKERDAETGLDYFGARYYSGAQGRFLSPDEFKGGIVDQIIGEQISQPGPLPYADLGNPQSLNKYAYVLNNPLQFIDPDGHADRNPCEGVIVEAKEVQQPAVVQNETTDDGRKATGVAGIIEFTVTKTGQPATGVAVTEKNEEKITRNDKELKSDKTEIGKGDTKAGGKIQDKFGIRLQTDGKNETNRFIKQDLKNNKWSMTGVQVLTLTFPGGLKCSATSTRTITNTGPDGLQPKYTLTFTQPIVRSAN